MTQEYTAWQVASLNHKIVGLTSLSFAISIGSKIAILRPSLCSDLEIYITGQPLSPSTCYTHVKDRHFCGMPTVHHSYMLSSD